MNKRMAAALIVFLSLALAQSAQQILQESSRLLSSGPWRARLVGKIVGPGGELQEADMTVKSLPSLKITRIEFSKPDALADNYLVITPEKVYNYLFLTNQVVVYPRAKARIEGLGFDLSRMGELNTLAERKGLKWQRPLAVSYDGVAAWKLVGVANDPQESGFGRVEVYLGRHDSRPLRTAFFSTADKLLLRLSWREFHKAKFNEGDLVSFPADAEWIKKN